MSGRVAGLVARLNRAVDFPRPGWWAVHLAGIAAVYSLGHLLWR